MFLMVYRKVNIFLEDKDVIPYNINNNYNNKTQQKTMSTNWKKRKTKNLQ